MSTKEADSNIPSNDENMDTEGESIDKFSTQFNSPPIQQHENNVTLIKNNATPALIRMKKSKQEFEVHSPSDALMSPCTQQLHGPKPKLRGVSQPQNLLRNKQHKDLTEKFCDVLNQENEDKDLN